MLKNKFLTLLAALIPGAGQMYQGYMKRGLSLTLIACAIGFVGVLLEPVLIFLCPVWLYSFFDTLNLRAQLLTEIAPAEDDYLVHLDLRDQRLVHAMLDDHKAMGWALIIFGALAAYKGILMSIFGDLVYRWGQRVPAFRALYLVLDHLPEVVVCVTIIICGIWLVKGRRSKKPAPADETDNAILLSAPAEENEADAEHSEE